MTHVLSTFNTTPLVRSVIEPLLPFDPMPELKFDIEMTAIGIKNEEIIRKKDELYSLPCVKKYGGGLLKNGTLKKRRAFVSYPRSGNTWTKGLILSLFGFYITGSSARSKVPKDCGCTLLTKTHDYSVLRENYTRSLEVDQFDGNAILLIRNPFRSFISRRALIQQRCEHALNLDDSYIQEKGWGQFVVSATAHWERLALEWIRGIKRGGIFYYENFLRNYEPEVERLASTLGLTIDPERYQCAIGQRNIPLHTLPEQFVYPSDPYTECQKLTISQAIERVQMALKERNFDPLPLESYQFYQPTEEFCNLECPIEYTVEVVPQIRPGCYA